MVYHPGVSLNKDLLTGSDLMNSLLGVLIRFRQENIAIMCDIEQMFHLFHVDPKHRLFLRFLSKDNYPSKEIVEFKMSVDLFGNGPVLHEVATFGLRKTTGVNHDREFVNRDFYVGDGQTSCHTECEAINLVEGAQMMLSTANLHLHKVASNSTPVMEALPAEDRAKDLDVTSATWMWHPANVLSASIEIHRVTFLHSKFPRQKNRLICSVLHIRPIWHSSARHAL